MAFNPAIQNLFKRVSPFRHFHRANISTAVVPQTRLRFDKIHCELRRHRSPDLRHHSSQGSDVVTFAERVRFAKSRGIKTNPLRSERFQFVFLHFSSDFLAKFYTGVIEIAGQSYCPAMFAEIAAHRCQKYSRLLCEQVDNGWSENSKKDIRLDGEQLAALIGSVDDFLSL